jgi:hypothetical protein
MLIQPDGTLGRFIFCRSRRFGKVLSVIENKFYSLAIVDLQMDNSLISYHLISKSIISLSSI